jgi:hypothetical protein
MKVTNILIISVLMFGITFFSNSCKKYEDGPAFSLRSPMKRITGAWGLSITKINNVLVDPTKVLWLSPDEDTSILSLFEFPGTKETQAIIADFEDDGDGRFLFFITIMSFSINTTEYFTWCFDEDKKNIIINYNEEAITLEIIRLTNDEMTLLRTETGDGTIHTTTLEFLKNVVLLN